MKNRIIRYDTEIRYVDHHLLPSKVIKIPVSLLDVTPTILELTGLTNQSSPIPTKFSGRSLSRAIQNGEVLAPNLIRFLTFSGKQGWATT